jgi:pimeloyl-ACP methyl ester carboxylesterase
MNRSVELGHVNLDYSRFGHPSQPAVLLLHPWFGCAGFWEPVLPVLAGCMVVVPDLYSPARGEWRAVANPESLATSLVAVLDAEGVSSCRVVGNSMGGILAQLLATREPRRFSHLVLIGTGARSGRLRSGFRTLLERWLHGRSPSDLAALTRGLVAPRCATDPIVEACVAKLAAVDPDYVAAIPSATLAVDLRSRLGAVTARTLVVRGQLDAIRTRVHARELAAAIPDARAVEIAGAGHSPMVDSTPQLNRILARFLEL